MATLDQEDLDNIAAAVLSAEIEGGYSLKEVLRLGLAVLAGKSTGTGASINYRDVADTKDRVAATIDSVGNRTVTLDVTD